MKTLAISQCIIIIGIAASESIIKKLDSTSIQRLSASHHSRFFQNYFLTIVRGAILK